MKRKGESAQPARMGVAPRRLAPRHALSRQRTGPGRSRKNPGNSEKERRKAEEPRRELNEQEESLRRVPRRLRRRFWKNRLGPRREKAL
jgi:hypothetical protein